VMTPFCPPYAGRKTKHGSHHHILFTSTWKRYLHLLIERHPQWHDRARSLFTNHLSGTGELITSTLTLGELLAQPLRTNRTEQAQRYIELLTTTERLRLVSFDRDAAERYAAIRATTSLRQPDAIQLACAAAANVEAFVTNDQRLWGLNIPEIGVISSL
jgi:predicted nucleic acid-binding protein